MPEEEFEDMVEEMAAKVADIAIGYGVILNDRSRGLIEEVLRAEFYDICDRTD